MPQSLDGKLVIAVSSRALFDLDDANRVFESQGVDEYRKYQLARLEEAAQPGVAHALVTKLLRFNSGEDRRVEVIVLSRNDPVSGLRVFHSTRTHGIDVSRGIFTRGRPPYAYLKPFGAALFLSAEPADVRGALQQGFPAATVYTGADTGLLNTHPDELRIAFDGDGVLFDDSSETFYRLQGIEAFHQSESENAEVPLGEGPFMPFLRALAGLRASPPEGCPVSVRTMLITARSVPAHERAIKTLMKLGLEVDEAVFLGGLDKAQFLNVFQPDFYFDDQRVYCDSAAGVARTGHVPFGVANSSGD